LTVITKTSFVAAASDILMVSSSSSSSSFEENASLPSLIAFGFAFGLAHVLSGPDHVIALAVIASSSSTNASSEKSSPISNSDDDDEEEEQSAFAIDDRRKADEYDDDENDEERATSSSFVSDDERSSNRRRRRENILLGLSWAVGHSLGLSFLVCLFFALKRELNVSAIGDVGDKIVGFTMLCVAFAAARGAKKFREREKAEKEHVRDEKAEGEGEEKAHAGDEVVLEIDPTAFGARVVTSGSKEHEEMHARREPHVHQSKRGGEDERREEDEDDDFCGDKAEIIADEGEPKREDDDHQKPISKNNNSLCFDDDDATKTTAAAEKKKKKKKDSSTGDKAKKSAFLVGLVHGVSGVSGILGVLPGVVLNSSSKSAAFIVSFLLCSTFAMTLFSVLLGETLRKAAALAQGGGRRKKLADANLVVFWVNVFFAVGAFACGCAWLYLSFSGKGVDV